MKSNQDKLTEKSIVDFAYETVGPVMYNYTEWVLSESQKRGFKRLYFLARDGYLLCEIARKICDRQGIDIECRYLYCSRQALRIPSYHIIGEEAFDLLTLKGFYLTPKSVISRAMLDKKTEEDILGELGITDVDKPFAESEFDVFAEALRKNKKYREAVKKISLSAYSSTIEYFKEEGLFEKDLVAIVDSGWTGSMQRSLRQLMQNEGYCGRFVGFYFGMYVNPKSEDDGEYLTYYFNAEKGFFRKLFFNNNLFECMLSAPHPMTLGYENKDGRIFPVFAKDHDKSLMPLIEEQISGALRYTDEYLANHTSKKEPKKALRECYKKLKRAMVYPTTSEALLLSNFVFCDDVTEGYRKSIADKNMLKKLSAYGFFPRLFRKLTGRKNFGANEIFWVYGVIAFCPKITRPWHRINVLMWDVLKALLLK